MTTAIPLILIAALVVVQNLLAEEPEPIGLDSTTFGDEPPSRPRTHQVRQAISEHAVIYGEARVSGPLLYARTTSNDNLLHLLIAFVGHECAAIDDVLLTDVTIPDADLDGDGLVTAGIYANKVRLRKHLGTAAQAADVKLVAEVAEWTANHRLREIAYLYARLAFDQDIFPTGIPGISAWIKGRKVLDPRDSVTRWTPNPALAVRDYLTNSRFGLAAATGEIDDASFIAAANVCEEMVATETLAETVAAVDTAADTLELSTTTALPYQTGDRVQVTTTGTLPTGIAAVTDYFIVVVRRANGPRVALATSYAGAIAGTLLDITGTGSGTHTVSKNAEPRYTTNGSFATDQDPSQVIEDLLSSMAGRLSHTGDVWSLRAGAFTAASLTFDESDLRGPLGVQTRHPRRGRFNAVKGVYASPLNAGVETDYPPITNSTYETADNGERLWAERNLPFTSRPHTAQRLAKIALERHRQEISVAFPANLTGLQLKVGDTVDLDNTRMGWSGKAFEVASWSLPEDRDDEGNPLFGVDLGLRETASAVYDWASGEETSVDPAPNTNLPDPFTVAAPTGLAVSSEQVLTGTGDETFRALVTWTAPLDSLVLNGGRIEAQWKESADADWRPSWFVEGDETETVIYMLEKGVDYDLRVRSINHFGVRSAYSTVTNFTVTSPGGATAQLDYGQFSDSVTENLDYGQFSDAVTANLDYGEFA